MFGGVGPDRKKHQPRKNLRLALYVVVQSEAPPEI